MNDFTEELVSALGDQVTPQLSKELNVDSKIASQILPMLAPVLMGALKRKKETASDNSWVDMLKNLADPDGLDDVAGSISKRASEPDDSPAVGGLLGDVGDQAAELLNSKLGLGKGQSRNAIYILAPIVLGYLMKEKGKGGSDISALSALIDSDGDGNIMDDVGGHLFKHLASRHGSGNSPIGSLLGGLLK